MKEGRALQELAQEVERQANSKRDFLADTRRVGVLTVGESPRFRLEGQGDFGITRLAHHQIAERTGIPQKYYDRLLGSDTGLWIRNVNHWLTAEPQRRMIRTLDRDVRAILSDRYRPLDNIDLLKAVLPRIRQTGCEIKSCEITESRLYLKAVTARIQEDVKVGDTVQAGIVISNSEVGLGSIRIEPLIFRLSCLNGMIVNDAAMRATHIGRQSGNGGVDLAQEWFRDETRRADDTAFWLKVRDTVDAAVDVVQFRKTVDRLREAQGLHIKRDVPETVEAVGEKYGFSDQEGSEVLRHLIEGGDLSAWGLGNAITRTSQDVPSYDRATELERVGFDVTVLPQSEWARLAISRN